MTIGEESCNGFKIFGLWPIVDENWPALVFLTSFETLLALVFLSLLLSRLVLLSKSTPLGSFLGKRAGCERRRPHTQNEAMKKFPTLALVVKPRERQLNPLPNKEGLRCGRSPWAFDSEEASCFSKTTLRNASDSSPRSCALASFKATRDAATRRLRWYDICTATWGGGMMCEMTWEGRLDPKTPPVTDHEPLPKVAAAERGEGGEWKEEEGK
mmetsp:Transcript_1522/g.2174  ORF Transcript_1522/g.2174 Transcript_1522/m.2174 type:complete len:213 (+) Transcript_1522:435-1073(+)